MQLQDTVVIPIVMAIVEAVKLAGLPTKFAPILAVVTGVAIAVSIAGVNLSGVLNGLLFGLSASGLYSGAKKVTN